MPYVGSSGRILLDDGRIPSASFPAGYLLQFVTDVDRKLAVKARRRT